MSIFGGSKGKDKVAKPSPGMMENPKPVYHGNPLNMDTSMFRTQTDNTYVPKEPSMMSTRPKQKNSLMSSRRI